MRALEMTRPGDPSVLHDRDREIPPTGPSEILIRVAYAGLNFTDVLARRGAPGYAENWPFVPGMEVSGTVDALGADVDGFGIGDRVLAFTPSGGGFAEFAVADARLVAAIPAGMELTTATTVPLTWATALGLVRRAQVEAGDAVLVTSAAGGIGSALAATLATREPGVIIGGVSIEAKAHMVAGGYSALVRGDDFYPNAVARAGKRFDVILDSLGGTLLSDAADHLDAMARLVSYGAAAGTADPEPPAYAGLRGGNLTVSGFSIRSLARTAPHRVTSLIRDVLTSARDGDTPITPPSVIDWADLIETHVRQSEGRTSGKFVVAVTA